MLGPPPTFGTRDAFAELVLEGGCKQFLWIKVIKKQNKSKYKSICHGVREDHVYIVAGENDNLIVQKLAANPDAFGVFGFSFFTNGDSREPDLAGVKGALTATILTMLVTLALSFPLGVAAAILVLLGFLLVMNTIATFLRKKFEK